MHEVLVNRLGGLSLPRKSVVRLTDRPDMTLDVYRGRKTTNQHILLFCNLHTFLLTPGKTGDRTDPCQGSKMFLTNSNGSLQTV